MASLWLHLALMGEIRAIQPFLLSQKKQEGSEVFQAIFSVFPGSEPTLLLDDVAGALDEGIGRHRTEVFFSP
jgi:hypothetical protein